MKLEEMNEILTPQDLMKILPNHGRTKIYGLLKNGDIESIKSGNTYLILKEALLKYLRKE
jgi:hypothetical protein